VIILKIITKFEALKEEYAYPTIKMDNTNRAGPDLGEFFYID